MTGERRSSWFAVVVTTAEPHYGPRINRYSPAPHRWRRLVGVSIHFGRRGISIGKYLPTTRRRT